MGNLSPNFDSTEFMCKCGCGKFIKNMELIQMLERLRENMNAAAIIVTSGTRCPAHSVNVGGASTDAHTKGIAADIRVNKKDGTTYTSGTIAREAEKIGFSGIGIIDNIHCHVDIRNLNNYYNNHWFGDERTHNDFITTFANYGEPILKDDKHKVKISIELDGKKVEEKTIEI